MSEPTTELGRAIAKRGWLDPITVLAIEQQARQAALNDVRREVDKNKIGPNPDIRERAWNRALEMVGMDLDRLATPTDSEVVG